MKKYIILLGLIATLPIQMAPQTVNVDSLMEELISRDIIGKVEQHEEIVQRISWVSPSILAPTVLAILALAYSLFLHFFGLERRAKTILTSRLFEAEVDNVINKRVVALAREKELVIKAKPVCLIYLSGKDMRKLPKFLSDCGFLNVTPFTTKDNIDIASNTVVIFQDEDGDFTDQIGDFIKSNESIKSKGHFFYFGSKRFSDPNVQMRNFANSVDTLAARLFESLAVS